MLSKISNFFSPKSTAPATTRTIAPQAQRITPAHAVPAAWPASADTGIKRDEGLVKKLTDDHRQLLAVYGQVMHDAESGEWQSVEQKLSEFQSLLTDHLLLESVKVYAYLKQRYKTDEAIFGSIQDFSNEMNGIRKHVVTSLANYGDISINESKQHTFPELWRGIGHALGNRIQREEKSLYTLY